MLERAGYRCECLGECDDHQGERCDAPHGERICRRTDKPGDWSLAQGLDPTEGMEGISTGVRGAGAAVWKRPIRVVLTIAHLDHPSLPSRCKVLEATIRGLHGVFLIHENTAGLPLSVLLRGSPLPPQRV